MSVLFYSIRDIEAQVKCIDSMFETSQLCMSPYFVNILVHGLLNVNVTVITRFFSSNIMRHLVDSSLL
jgi:hypothetical protein